MPGQAGQGEVDNERGVPVRVGGQPRPLRGRAEDHPDDDCSVEAVEQEADRGVGGQVAAIDGPVQQCPGPSTCGMAIWLENRDVPAELHVYPGGIHGFDLLAPASRLAQRFVRDRDEALRRAFGQ